MGVFRQIFLLDEYASIRNLPSPTCILDLGANVGYSSAYFLSCFPTATVLAVEPDPGNFELCRKNLAPYGERAQVVLGAVWSKRCKLVLSRGVFGDGREWATQVYEGEVEKDQAFVESWDVPGLMELVGTKDVDLLKIDIERSELEVFSANTSAWLSSIRTICIELHGDDCREVFVGALRGFEYTSEISGELTICRNLRPKGTPETASVG
jgi:FkbM family methyltransferase